MNRVVEIWSDKLNNLNRITWNPCNCCPNSVMKEYGPKFKKAVSYIKQNKSAFTKYMIKNGWKRLERKVISLK